MTDVTRFVHENLAIEHELLPGGIPEETIDPSAEAVDDWQPWRAIPVGADGRSLVPV